jgi:hypothetical protein
MKLKPLVGSGDKIGLFAAPFLIVGLILNILFPSLFSVGGPQPRMMNACKYLVIVDFRSGNCRISIW